MGRRKKRKGLMGIFNFGKRRGRRSVLSNFNVRGMVGDHMNLSPETKRGIFTVFLFVLGALCLLGLFGLAGQFGEWIVSALAVLFGSLMWLFPILILAFVYFMIRSSAYEIKFINYLGATLLMLGLASAWHLRFGIEGAKLAAQSGLGGGYFGMILSIPLLRFMNFWGGVVVSLAVFLIGLLLSFETSLYGLMWPVKLFKFIGVHLARFYMTLQQKIAEHDSNDEENDYEEEEGGELEDVKEDTKEKSDQGEGAGPQFNKKDVKESEDGMDDIQVGKIKKFGRKIELPLELLTSRSTRPTSGDIKSNQESIKNTLANFNINVEMGEVNVGPTVTQYTLRPADGVKLSKIMNLNNDLSLSLAAHPIRIEAPIPGRSLVGIEIPNQTAAKVTMRELLTSSSFKKRDSNLSISLGKDVSGKPYFADLTKMPHLLVAGATGSGKSVCINSIIVSLLYQNSPDELKFILVDPKRVELPVYNSIPYLLTPVITDAKKTINALKWTIVEMERRFDLLSRKGKRNIECYNKSTNDKLPYIVFIIDELADLMSVASADMEAGIVRLAQMARAVGIHLVLATQRPSVEVITGLIKANIPARISFSVASLIDSRTILDTSGAEKLIGRGDMLFLDPHMAKPKRLQGVFLSEQETKGLVKHIKEQGGADYVEEVVEKQGGGQVFGGSSFSDDDGDALLGDAKEVIREAGKASASLLQRRLKVGYARAARMLDLLENQGIVGPADGAKPREIFLDRLGGVDNVVEFAAKEHDLEGELAEEQTPTVFKTEEAVEESSDEVNDEELLEQDEAVEESSDEVNDEELLEQDEAVEKTKKSSDEKDEFNDDEWT